MKDYLISCYIDDEMDLDEFEVAELRLKKADNWNRQTQNLLKPELRTRTCH